MTERNARPATNDNIGWNTTPTNPSTDPGGALRAAGWATDAIPGSDEFNYIQTMLGDNALWIESFIPREWEDIREALAKATVRDLFRVVPPLAAMRGRLDEAYSTAGTAATGGFPSFMCTDGEQIYYIAGAGNVSLIAARPTDGVEIWESGAVTQFLAITADGLFVYASGAAADVGLRKIDRTDGTAAGNVNGTGHSYRLVRANGVYVVMIAPSVNLGKMDVFTAAAPTFTANAAPTGNLNALGIDVDRCYIGGTRNAGKDVWAYDLADVGVLVAVWSTALDANDPSPVNSIVADGDYVYVACDSFAIAAGGNRGLFCLDRVTGLVVWSMDLGADVDFLATDGVYLYAADSAEDLHMIKLAVGPGEVHSPVADVASHIARDGVSVFCSDGATPANFRRLWTGGPTRTFMRAAPADPTRRPWPNLAIPIDGRT